MVVGFVNSGMMKVRQSISIVLGAILGTSITGWIICLSDIGSTGGWMDLFSTATLTGVISVIGIVLRMASKDPAKKHIGDILMGFAVLMFGMSTMSAAVSPLREDPTFIRILTSFSNPFLGILFGTLFTCVLQSASAAVGILQALASTGIIDFSIALPIIMGIAIGAALPVLLSAIGANVDGKRTAMVYLVVEVVGVIFWAAAFYLVNAFVHFDFMSMTMSSVSIAFVNTLFRFVKVVILLPFIDVIEKVVDLLVKDKPVQAEATDETIRLEERFIGNAYMFSEAERKKILKIKTDAPSPAAVVKPFYDRVKDKDPVTKMQFVDLNAWMVGDILLKADKMSMANSLELRVPFLDKEVMALAQRIPLKYRVNSENTKYAMRKAALRRMPEKWAGKKKLGFPVPTRVWLKEDKYYNIVREKFTGEVAEKFFHTEQLVKLLDDHKNGRALNMQKIWSFYTFIVWYEQFFVLN